MEQENCGRSRSTSEREGRRGTVRARRTRVLSAAYSCRKDLLLLFNNRKTASAVHDRAEKLREFFAPSQFLGALRVQKCFAPSRSSPAPAVLTGA
jgi:hypothetical protein